MTPLSTSEAIEAQLRAKTPERVRLQGTVERVAMGKGRKTWLGTALVLDDGTAIWLTSGAPPASFEPVLGQFIEVEGVLSRASSTVEQSLLAPHLLSPGPPHPRPRTLASLEGRRVELVGLAENAKGGPVVLVDGSPVYLEGRPEWPKHVRTKRVALGGVLTSKSLLPVAETNARGEVSQGVSGESKQWVLEGATEATGL